MSRIGKLPVAISSGVSVTIDGRRVTVTGPKGTLTMVHPPHVSLKEGEGTITVAKKGNSRQASEQYGLSRTLLANMVQGVAEGFERHLEISGVGYRAQVSGRSITLNVGFSHPIEYQLPEGVEAQVEGN